MEAIRKFVFFGVFFLTTVYPTTRESSLSATTCEAGIYRIGEAARVTCHFSDNVVGHHFHVVMYSPHAAVSSGAKDVLRCHWTSPTYPECSVGEGFRFDYSFSNKVTVTIHKVTAEMAGQYVCQRIPATQGSRGTCYLIVNEVTMASPAEEITTQEKTVSTYFECSHQKDIFYVNPLSSSVAMCASLIVSLFGNIISGLIIYKMCKKQRQSEKENKGNVNAATENDELLNSDVNGNEVDQTAWHQASGSTHIEAGASFDGSTVSIYLDSSNDHNGIVLDVNAAPLTANTFPGTRLNRS